jgi:hypothetical protein
VRRRRRLQRDTYCRACRSAYGKEHYAKHRQTAVSRRRARERQTRILESFEDHPCVDCGERDAVVLEFDHLRDRSFDIGANLHYARWETILAEIAKCEVVFANCHRRRTARRRDGLRLQLQVERANAKRATGLEPAMGAWKAPVLPATPHPRVPRV